MAPRAISYALDGRNGVTGKTMTNPVTNIDLPVIERAASANGGRRMALAAEVSFLASGSLDARRQQTAKLEEASKAI